MTNEPKRGKLTKTLQGRCFFLTIPKTQGFTKASVLALLEKQEPDLQTYLISEESHKENECTHFHLYLTFNKRKQFSFSHFDYLCKHGNLQRVKSSANLLQYICKEDLEPLSNFNLIETKLSKKFQKNIIELIEQGYSVNSLFAVHGKALAHKPWLSVQRLAASYKEALKFKHKEDLALNPMQEISRELIESKLTPQELALFDSFEGYQQLIDVFNQIITKRYKQDHKDCCISIVGEPNIGKTYLIRELAQYLPIYNYPEDGWHRSYDNNLYSAIFWNEWKLSVHDMEDYLRLFEGDPVDLKVKGSKANKEDCPYIILVSNDGFKAHLRKRFRYCPAIGESYIRPFQVRIKQINFEKKPLGFLSKLFSKK